MHFSIDQETGNNKKVSTHFRRMLNDRSEVTSGNHVPSDYTQLVATHTRAIKRKLKEISNFIFTILWKESKVKGFPILKKQNKISL